MEEFVFYSYYSSELLRKYLMVNYKVKDGWGSSKKHINLRQLPNVLNAISIERLSKCQEFIYKARVESSKINNMTYLMITISNDFFNFDIKLDKTFITMSRTLSYRNYEEMRKDKKKMALSTCLQVEENSNKDFIKKRFEKELGGPGINLFDEESPKIEDQVEELNDGNWFIRVRTRAQNKKLSKIKVQHEGDDRSNNNRILKLFQNNEQFNLDAQIKKLESNGVKDENSDLEEEKYNEGGLMDRIEDSKKKNFFQKYPKGAGKKPERYIKEWCSNELCKQILRGLFGDNKNVREYFNYNLQENLIFDPQEANNNSIHRVNRRGVLTDIQIEFKLDDFEDFVIYDKIKKEAIIRQDLDDYYEKI